MRVAILALVVFLVLAIALPLATLLSKSFQDSTGRFVGLANYARYFSTPSLVASLWNSFWVAMVATIIVVPLAFLYAYGLTRTRMRAKGFFLAVALLPLFAPSLLLGHLADLHLRQPGLPQDLAVRRQRVRADRHHPGAGVLLLAARDDDPHHRARARRRAALRGGRGHGHAALARVSHRHAARRALRPDIGDVRGLHAGGDGFRHRQGDRRPVQRAGDGCLQAGDRPAELRDGRGGRLRAAGARRGRLRPRPADPAAPGGAAVGARRAARAARQCA